MVKPVPSHQSELRNPDSASAFADSSPDSGEPRNGGTELGTERMPRPQRKQTRESKQVPPVACPAERQHWLPARPTLLCPTREPLRSLPQWAALWSSISFNVWVNRTAEL